MVRHRSCVGVDEYGFESEMNSCKCPGENILFDDSSDSANNIPWKEIDENYERYKPSTPGPQFLESLKNITETTEFSTKKKMKPPIIAAISVPVIISFIFIVVLVIFCVSKSVKKKEASDKVYPEEVLSYTDNSNDVYV